MMKLGKQPARPGAVKLRFADFADTTKLDEPPPDFGHERLIGWDWGMLGNDRVGDCYEAGALHEVMLWNAEAGRSVPVDAEAAIANYSELTGYDPGAPVDPATGENPTDNGTDVAIALAKRRSTGLLDGAGRRHPIGAYVALDPGNWEQLRYAAYYFDGVGLGLQMPRQWMQQFPRTWDAVVRPQPAGGHYVPCVAFRDGNAVLVSWGGLVEITQAGYEQASDEAYAYLTVEKFRTGAATATGIDVDALRAQLQALTSVE